MVILNSVLNAAQPCCSNGIEVLEPQAVFALIFKL